MKKFSMLFVVLFSLCFAGTAQSDGYLRDYLNSDEFGNVLGLSDSLALKKVTLGSPIVVGTDVFMDIEAEGGGSIPFYTSDGLRELDCVTGSGVGGKARVQLLQGTFEEPTWQFIYAYYSEQDDDVVLVTSEVIPSEASYLSVAYVMLQTYVETAATGPIVWHKTTDLASWKGRSGLSYEREKLRLALHNNRVVGAEVMMDVTTNVGARDNIDVISQPGTLYQLHKHYWLGYSAAVEGIRIIGQEVGSTTIKNYEVITDLGAITETREGEAIPTGHSILVDFVAVMNSCGQEYLAAYIGSDTYASASDAVHSAKLAANKRFPRDLDQVCATLGRAVLTYTDADSGTWDNALDPTSTTYGWTYHDVNESTPGYPGYANNLDEYFGTTHTFPGATEIRVRFSNFNTEANYDYVYLRDGSTSTNRRTYHGNLGAFTSGGVYGDTIRYYIHTDGSVPRDGAYIDYLEYYGPVSTTGVSGKVLDRR